MATRTDFPLGGSRRRAKASEATACRGASSTRWQWLSKSARARDRYDRPWVDALATARLPSREGATDAHRLLSPSLGARASAHDVHKADSSRASSAASTVHYAPTAGTLQGEPPGIFAFLGSHRLAEPIVRHRPDLVLHGYAHAGTVEGTIEGVPVLSVSVPVIKRDVWLYEHAGAPRAEREGRQLRMV